MHIIKTLALCGVLALGLGAVSTTLTSCGPSKEELKTINGITDLAAKVEKEAAAYSAEDWEKIYKEYDELTKGGSADWDSEEFQQANAKLLAIAAQYIDKGADPSRFAAKVADASDEPSIDGGDVVSADGEMEVGTEVEISVE